MSNQKGGVAKSSCAFNLGIGLARQGKKVLIVDLDPQRFSDCKYGGSSMLILSATVGIIMNISMQQNRDRLVMGKPFVPETGGVKNV